MRIFATLIVIMVASMAQASAAQAPRLVAKGVKHCVPFGTESVLCTQLFRNRRDGCLWLGVFDGGKTVLVSITPYLLHGEQVC